MLLFSIPTDFSAEEDAIGRLLEVKRRASEIGLGARIGCLDALIDEMVDRASTQEKAPCGAEQLAHLQAGARDLLGAAAGWTDAGLARLA